MKKFVSLFLTATLLVAALCLLTACGTQETPAEVNHVSYMQQSFYLGETRDFAARLVAGTSEPLFVADGKTDAVQPFATLTLVPQHVDLFNEDYDFVLKGEAGELSGKLDKDSFGASYSAELKDLDKIGTPAEVTVKWGDKTATIALGNVLDGAITGAKALEAAQKHLEKTLAADDKEREIYVKYINDAESKSSAYYWYVAFIASPTDYYAVLVDAQGNIVSTNP